LHHLTGGTDDAVALYREAYRHAADADLTGLALDAAHMLAIARPDEEDRWVEAALVLADGSTDPLVPGMLGALLTNLGFSRVDEDRWDEAAQAFQDALAAYERRPDPATVETARSTYTWALEARDRYRKSRDPAS
jgi:hypothetical protein